MASHTITIRGGFTSGLGGRDITCTHAQAACTCGWQSPHHVGPDASTHAQRDARKHALEEP